MKEHEGEIPEDLQEFIKQAQKGNPVSEIIGEKDKEQKLPIELTAEQFFLEVKGAFDHYSRNRKIAEDQMQIALDLVNTANMFEQNPNFRVGYLKFPDGLLGLSVEPKGDMGFDYPDERKRDSGNSE